MLEFGKMQSNPSLPSLPSPLWLGVATDRVLSMGQIELNCVLMHKIFFVEGLVH